jgi:hypothetical protein
LLYKKGSTSIKSITSKVALNSNCKYNDPDLCKFLNNWQDVKYFTANSTSTFEGKQQQTVMKSINPDKFQMTSLAGSAENFNMISIGDTTYTKDYTDNKWLKVTSEKESDTVKSSKDEFDYNLEEDKTEYKKIGTEACGKLTCFKYQVIDPEQADFNSKEYILFDNKEYTLRKTITEGPDNNIAIIEFDYSKISIDVPSPIKEDASSSIPSAPSSQSSSNNSSSLEQAINDASNAAEQISANNESSQSGPPVPAAPLSEPLDE